jgi:hypothetical protein
MDNHVTSDCIFCVDNEICQLIRRDQSTTCEYYSKKYERSNKRQTIGDIIRQAELRKHLFEYLNRYAKNLFNTTL